MKISFKTGPKGYSLGEIIVVAAFSTIKKNKNIIDAPRWPDAITKAFRTNTASANFTGSKESEFSFSLPDATPIIAVGLGERNKLNFEAVRKAFARIYRCLAKNYSEACIVFDDFIAAKNRTKSLEAAVEGLLLSAYTFETYKKLPQAKMQSVIFHGCKKNTFDPNPQATFKRTDILCNSVNFCRDLVNEPPNVLNSTEYAKRIQKDVQTNLKGVGIKILGKKELQKEKMGMFLSVNAGSAHPPKLIHLTYSPPKATQKTQHIALVGKGLTFDTGGYSLKPSSSIINMKYDMAGSATLYAAFRAAVLTKAPIKLSCFLGITDNAINEHATMPDSIVTSRKGKTVEILNTDAEGRLVLGDVLDYACSHKPDTVIDAATLTGACLVSLGQEVCGLMGNNDALKSQLKKAAKETAEYIWELPIIEEWHKDMESPIADLRNIGNKHFAGTSKAAAFLENFISDNIAWAHLDIAGVANSQSHLPYCSPTGASGLMVRTLFHYLHATRTVKK